MCEGAICVRVLSGIGYCVYVGSGVFGRTEEIYVEVVITHLARVLTKSQIDL